MADNGIQQLLPRAVIKSSEHGLSVSGSWSDNPGGCRVAKGGRGYSEWQATLHLLAVCCWSFPFNIFRLWLMPR